MTMEWGVIQYQAWAEPTGDPSDWIEPVWFEAWQNLSTWLIPIRDPRSIYGDIANIPSNFFVDDPSNLFEVVWMSWAGQQSQDTLMPNYDPRFIGGDIGNMPALALQLAIGVHFDPNASGIFQGPAIFDILEGSADFELRVPL